MMLDKTYYRTEGVPAFINERLDLDRWRTYLSDYDFGRVPPKGLVLHHTAVPTLAQWTGLGSMRAMQLYYANALAWGAAPHFYVDDVGIWLATPMHLAGIHAQAANCNADAFYQSEVDDRWYIDNSKVKYYHLGLEMVGNFERERPRGYQWELTKTLMGTLCQHFNWSVTEAITFHRDWTDTKTCPGSSISHDWVHGELCAWTAQPHVPIAPPNPAGAGLYIAKWRCPVRQAPFISVGDPNQNVSYWLDKDASFTCGAIKQDGDAAAVNGDRRWLWEAGGRGFCHISNFRHA